MLADHAWRGESDAAFEWLERACVQHDGGRQTIRYDPLLAKLRDDRRYVALMGRMGLALR